MPYTISNSGASAINVGQVTLEPGQSTTVDFLTTQLKAAVAASQLACSPSVPAKPSLLTVSVGVGSTTIPDVSGAFSQTTLNNIVRSLANQINTITTMISDLADQVAALEQRADKNP
jgi:hypothetical protein